MSVVGVGGSSNPVWARGDLTDGGPVGVLLTKCTSSGLTQAFFLPLGVPGLDPIPGGGDENPGGIAKLADEPLFAANRVARLISEAAAFRFGRKLT